ncbi:hypothetical protein A7982_12537 [Minicystis rosea]|nr:hypothetical protein A7982_12537 [Minicystis rosea]
MSGKVLDLTWNKSFIRGRPLLVRARAAVLGRYHGRRNISQLTDGENLEQRYRVDFGSTRSIEIPNIAYTSSVDIVGRGR